MLTQDNKPALRLRLCPPLPTAEPGHRQALGWGTWRKHQVGTSPGSACACINTGFTLKKPQNYLNSKMPRLRVLLWNVVSWRGGSRHCCRPFYPARVKLNMLQLYTRLSQF